VLLRNKKIKIFFWVNFEGAFLGVKIKPDGKVKVGDALGKKMGVFEENF